MGSRALSCVKGNFKAADGSHIHKGRIDSNEYRQYLQYFLYLYLNQLIELGDGTDYPEFRDELVALYAQFDTTQLLRFLNLSNHVTFSKALSVCQNRLTCTQDICIRPHV